MGQKINPNLKILVVDDFTTMRRIVKNILNQIGYINIVEAEDGEQALTKLRAGGFGLVVSDWNMPNMDGYQLVCHVRSDDQLKDLPVLMVTAEADRGKVVAAIKAGVSNYIVKPFTASTLKEKMERILS